MAEATCGGSSWLEESDRLEERGRRIEVAAKKDSLLFIGQPVNNRVNRERLLWFLLWFLVLF